MKHYIMILELWIHSVIKILESQFWTIQLTIWRFLPPQTSPMWPLDDLVLRFLPQCKEASPSSTRLPASHAATIHHRQLCLPCALSPPPGSLLMGGVSPPPFVYLPHPRFLSLFSTSSTGGRVPLYLPSCLSLWWRCALAMADAQRDPFILPMELLTRGYCSSHFFFLLF